MSSTALLLASLTRRLAQVTIRPSSSVGKALVVSNNNPLQFTALRYKSGGSSKKKQAKRDKKKQAEEDTPNKPQQEPSALLQNWVELQQSIAVDGFDTGQITKASTVTGKKRRGGKIVRRRLEKQKELDSKTQERERMVANLGGGEFPPLRYSDEETERLLAIAYAAIPPRAGKRGTRNLKRQHLRWFRVRKIRAKQKYQRIRAHERRMVKRSRRVKQVLEVKAHAEEIRQDDKAYQEEVLRRWATQTMQRNEENHVVTQEQLAIQEQNESA